MLASFVLMDVCLKNLPKHKSPFGRGRSRGQQQRRGEDVVYPLKVSLEDLYNGTSKKLYLSRNVLCSKWVIADHVYYIGCHRQLGPSMIEQKEHLCNERNSTRDPINDKDQSTQCKGEKVVQEKKVLEVHVEERIQNGQK
ncbi:DnaJ protein [Tanacetum coccineum]|uniref:DnaJ protein n=1 Tax=Tanacetum coccineum TaxID=301880 RepID=A0ABQ5D9L3_9ASTR